MGSRCRRAAHRARAPRRRHREVQAGAMVGAAPAAGRSRPEAMSVCCSRRCCVCAVPAAAACAMVSAGGSGRRQILCTCGFAWVPKPYDTNHVLAWRDPGLPTPVYVRMDSSGVFYTYPTLGDKPFQSLDEVQSAVVSYACRNSNVMYEKLSKKERVIRERLFWPDGTMKVCTRAQVAKRKHDKVHRLVEALLDKQNDAEDRVDELKDIVHWQSICEGVGKWYYHLNITVKTKGAADDVGSASLFFAEVARDRNDMLGYYINTFFRVNTDSKDDEATCHGCINNGSNDMKHPPAGSFKGGHMDICFPIGFGPCNEKQWLVSHNTEAEDEELIKKEEKRIRECFDYLDDAVYLENIRRKRLHFRIWDEELDIQEDEEITYKDEE